ncbi:hypothetical protein [Sphingomonas sp. UYP23]
MNETPDTRPALITAIMNAMVDAMKDADGHSAFEPAEACRALSACTALILESSPAIKTSKDMRLASESVAREVRMQLRQWREVHEVTGQRAWYAAMGTAE